MRYSLELQVFTLFFVVPGGYVGG